MRQAADTLQPPSLRHRSSLVVAAFLALCCLVMAGAYFAMQRRALEDLALERVGLHARVIESDTNALFNGLAESMLKVEKVGFPAATAIDAAQVARAIEDPLARYPALRSLSVLDEQGQVVFSTDPAALGVHVPVPSLGTLAPSATVVIGAWLPVRSLADLAAAPAVQPRRGAIVMLLPMARADGSAWLLVGLVNPDSLAQQHARQIGASADSSAVLSYGGVVLQAGAQLALQPGTSARGLVPFQDYLPAREQGTYIGRGVGDSRAVVSFRTLRQWPVVVLVEQDYAAIGAELLQSAGWDGLVLLAAWAGIGTFVFRLKRSLLNEARNRARTDSLHQQIARNEERWKLALEGAGEGVWDWDLATGKADLSPKALAMLGYAPGAIGETGAHWAALFHPQDLERLRVAVTDRMAGRSEALRVEARVRRQDGSWCWALIRGEVAGPRDADMRVTRMIGTIADVSERKSVEFALRESEARALESFEQAAVGVLHQGLDRRFLRVNQKLCDMLGVTREECLALDAQQLVHPEDVEHGLGIMRKLIVGEASSLCHEKRFKHKDGHFVWTRMTSSLARSAAGEDSYLICIIEDIRQRKAVEQERHELLQRYQQTAAELGRQRLALDKHTLVSIVDAHGVVLYANSKLCEVSGYAVHELVGRRHSTLAHDAGDGTAWMNENPAEVRAAVLEHVAGARVWQGELVHRRKDGSPFWAATTVVPVAGDDGALHQVFVIQTDVTRRMVAERAAAEARNVELHIGARIQQSLLATVLDQRLPRTWLSASTMPSQGIDGDFLHVVTIGSDCVDVVTADVMGKGIGAALIGAAAKMQLAQCMAQLISDAPNRGRPEPATVVAALHKAMVPSLQSLEAFITICYVRIDSAANIITWVGCGHEEPLLVRRDGSTTTLANQHPPMGVLETVHYEQDTTALVQGDAFFSCSDGLCDALKPDGSRVGRAAVEAAVRRLLSHCKAPSAIVHALQRELVGPGVRAVDDTSLLLAMRTGDTLDASRREFPYSIDALLHVRGLVGFRCIEAGLDETASALFTVACVEAFTNIVRHSKGRLGDSKIELLVMLEAGQLTAEFVYLADAVELPGIREPALEEFPEGGFGLSIMREATDGLVHEHRDGINTIRLTKLLQG